MTATGITCQSTFRHALFTTSGSRCSKGVSRIDAPPFSRDPSEAESLLGAVMMPGGLVEGKERGNLGRRWISAGYYTLRNHGRNTFDLHVSNFLRPPTCAPGVLPVPCYIVGIPALEARNFLRRLLLMGRRDWLARLRQLML